MPKVLNDILVACRLIMWYNSIKDYLQPQKGISITGENMRKIHRQLQLYYHITTTEYHSPKDLMREFGIGQRMLQRDLEDLRYSGLLYLKYDRKADNYTEADPQKVKKAVKINERRRQHLKLLHRLATLMDNLTVTDERRLSDYESLLWEYHYYIELVKEDPVEFPPEDIGDPPEKPEFADIRAEYYELFPDCSERTRARDFATLTEAGFTVKYSRRHRAFLVGPDISPKDERHW